jgi:hypothetical protein
MEVKYSRNERSKYLVSGIGIAMPNGDIAEIDEGGSGVTIGPSHFTASCSDRVSKSGGIRTIFVININHARRRG